MEQRGYYLTVGSFMVLFILCITVFILWLGKINFDKEVHFYDIFFEGSVTGLSEGERVRYRGVPIGIVKRISVDSKDLRLIKVTIAVRDANLIRKNAVASLETSGITGIAYVQINGGSPNLPPLTAGPNQRHPVIASQPSRLEEVFQRVPQVLLKIQQVSDNINALLKPENRALMESTLKNVEKASQRTSETLKSLENNISTATQDFSKTFAKVEQTALQAEHTLKTLETFVKDNQSSIGEFTKGTLPELSELIEESRDAVGDIAKASQQVEQSLKRLIDHDIERGRKVN